VRNQANSLLETIQADLSADALYKMKQQ